MRWLSNRHATKVSCIAIVAALGMVDAPAWAGDGGETSIDLASPVFAAVESTGARALRDDEMGELRGGFLGGILDALPETNTAIVQFGDNTVSQTGPGALSAKIDERPIFFGKARANSSSSGGSSSSSSSGSFSSFSGSANFTRTSYGTTIR